VDPIAFTAGGNLCYMPVWAGMATEEQHPDEEVQRALCQASFDLFFRNGHVTPVPRRDGPRHRPARLLGRREFACFGCSGGSPEKDLSRSNVDAAR